MKSPEAYEYHGTSCDVYSYFNIRSYLINGRLPPRQKALLGVCAVGPLFCVFAATLIIYSEDTLLSLGRFKDYCWGRVNSALDQ